jgi:tRNA pseudouridine38-40 synthase
MLLHRYFIKLDYNGSHFHGWQIQLNAHTVQAEINTSLSTLLREDICVVGCGRTDTGVHARNFIAHFDSENTDLQLNANLIYKLNRILPKTIAIHSIKKMHADAHARFDAISRTYKYYIIQTKDPFNFNFQNFIYGEIDIELMNKAAQKLFDYIDFTSFSKVDTDVQTNNCKIMEAGWKLNGDQLIFTIKADRFLRNMVRAIVGTLLEVGTRKITVSDFCNIIESKNRGNAGSSAPGHALFLEEVCYPDDI